MMNGLGKEQVEAEGLNQDGQEEHQSESVYGRKRSFRRSLRFGWIYHYPLINGVLIVLSGLILVVLLIMVTCAGMLRDKISTTVREERGTGVESVTIDSVRVEAPFLMKEQILVGTGALAYIESDLGEEVSEVLAPYRQDETRMDAGYPVILNFDVMGLPMETEVEKILVEVDEAKTFLNARMIELDAQARSVSIYHLKTGTKYYYRITLLMAGGHEVGMQGSFQTARTPRLLSIDGIVNVRDMGGVKTTDGKTFKQGLLYRGSEMDGKTEFTITEAGVRDMTDVLGIRTELDLRYLETMTYPLGSQVKHICYGIAMYSEVLEEEYNEKVRMLFSDLAKSETYPAYMHCTYGENRTGTIGCILMAFLGVSEEDIIREHELSALYYSSVNTESLEQLLADLHAKEGRNLSEKAAGYLLSIGVTQEELDSIKQILLG